MNLSVNKLQVNSNKPSFGRDGQKAQRRDIEERLDELEARLAKTENKTNGHTEAISLLNQRIDGVLENVEYPASAKKIDELA